MFYRRKVLLALLEALGGTALKTDFEKLLFLVCHRQTKRSYEFVPHKYGCYSFQVDSDKRTLTKYGLVKDTEAWTLKGKARYYHLLHQTDQILISKILEQYNSLSGRALLREVYREHPYYAINSEIIEEVLQPSERESVNAARPVPMDASLFTIGYEGIALETYLRRLDSNQIRILCDVRKNPVSMKFGFSKNQLRNAAYALGIEYMHLPELGIDSKKRSKLESASDYKKLFKEYKATTLKNQEQALDLIVRTIDQRGRVALTCFEASHERCHRGCVSDALQVKGFRNDQIAHI